MKYGIAIFPSKKVQDEANALRKRYDPEYALIPPHITLRSRFDLSDVSLDDIVHALSDIASNTKPFTVNIHRVGTFAPVTNTIYFKVEPIPALETLHREMHQGVFPTDKEYAFVPHITISQELMDEEYHDVYGSLKMKKVELEDYIDRMQLCYQLDNGSWQVHETFKFAGK